MTTEIYLGWQTFIYCTIFTVLILSALVGVLLMLKEMNIGRIIKVLIGARCKNRKTYEGKVTVIYENDKGLMVCTKAKK